MNRDQVVRLVKDYVVSQNLIDDNDQVVVGISGGADSVCLLCILSEIYDGSSVRLKAVHVNHSIRDTAQRDQKYVEELCKKLNVPLKICVVDALEEAKRRGISTEEAGRILRYNAFLEAVDSDYNFKIAVAHNMDDNVETVILNMARGTGLRGMRGIPVKRQQIVRPLLCLSRQDIEAYLRERDIAYCIDETNLTDEYTRNRIRHNIIPYMKENINPDVVSNIYDMTKSLSDAEDYLINETNILFSKVYSDGIIYQEEFDKLHPYMKQRVMHKALGVVAGTLKDISRIHIDSCLDLFNKQVGKYVMLPYDIYVKRCYEGILVSQAKSNPDNPNLEDVNIIIKDFPYEEGMDIPDSKYTKWFDYDIISNGPLLRTRLAGDYLQVNDSGATKKLKEYLINEKIPADMRDGLPLIADGSHIMWVVGYRISAAYKVTEKTKRILEIEVVLN